MSVVLITGAFGFVGTNLSTYLSERGYEVWALDVGAENPKALKCKGAEAENNSLQKTESTQQRAYVRRYTWEQLDQICWSEIDAVVHLAGKAHDTRNTSDPRSYFAVNVGLTEKILGSFMRYCECKAGGEPTSSGQKPKGGLAHERKNSRANRIPKLIFFSSVKAVADQIEGVLTEETVPDPKTPYGQSKLEAEKVVISSFVRYAERGAAGEATSNGQRPEGVGSTTHERKNSQPNEFHYFILRPCMIHGPCNKGNLNSLYGMARRGIPWPLGSFENRRSFASIENVCAVVDGLLSGGGASGVYQVADDETISTNELIRLMSEAAGLRAKIWRLPPNVVRAVAWIGDLLCLPLNSERLKKLTESYVASNAKIKAVLGWDRMPVRAKDGMRKTLESFKE